MPLPDSTLQLTFYPIPSNPATMTMQEGQERMSLGLVHLLLDPRVVGVVLVVYLLYNKFHASLNSIPGPFLASFTNVWRLVDTAKGESQHTAIKLHRKYGPLVRLGPNVISVSDTEAIKTIYSVNGGFTKTPFYPIQEGRFEKAPLPNLFSTRDEDYHSKLKRPVAHMYSLATLLGWEHKMDEISKLFIDRLDKYATSGQEIDLGQWLQWYAFDIIGKLTFSTTFGFLEQGRDIEDMIANINGFFFYAAVVGQIPWLHNLLLGNPLLPLLTSAIENANPAVNFALKCIKERVSTKTTQHDDFLSRCEDLLVQKPDSCKRSDPVNHTSANVLAGSDTTAIALRAIIDNLARNPPCYRKLQTEIDEFDRVGQLSDPVSYAEAQKMTYLQAVIKEAMRLHPSVGMIMERYVPRGGAVIAGKRIPAGVIVGMNPWTVARDETIYGKDVDAFRPERWLEASDEQLKAMERTSLSFGGGSRVCIGRNISLVEMSKIIPQLFRVFDIALINPDERLKVRNYWFPVQEGLVCKMKRRTRL
ncbi:cytochrome P450 oxidoreductase [Ilyonectria destructans]|nr:cytochrome P450 oxidoreductase [Ilyonectria destructans]